MLLRFVWLLCVDLFLVAMAFAAWFEYQDTHDPTDIRYAFLFAAFACLSIPIFTA